MISSIRLIGASFLFGFDGRFEFCELGVDVNAHTEN
jgi:hypothetical protein